MLNELQRLQKWYVSQCNGDWEHQYGVAIGTLDNPGWWLRIELADTNLDTAVFPEISIERSKADWVHCKIENFVFHGHGGMENLGELLSIFLDWAESKGIK
jgi:Immunity protein 53